MKIITDKEVMRTPVVLVCGQGDTDRVAGTLMNAPGTAVVGHEFDGQVIARPRGWHRHCDEHLSNRRRRSGRGVATDHACTSDREIQRGGSHRRFELRARWRRICRVQSW